MDGEIRQPGGRAPAPGALALVQAFINTHYDLEDHGGDVFASPDELECWLASRGLLDGDVRLTRRDLARAITARELLRELAASDAAGFELLNDVADGATVELRFGAGGPRFVPPLRAGLDGALGVLMAIIAQALRDGSWSRLKVCPGEDCGWAFYDNSRNQTGRWCSMSVCGGRAKARAPYRRRRGGEF